MLATLLIALVRVYQRTLSILLRGAFGPVCRFEPSCSHYAVACLEGHGPLRGSLLSFKRLCRCSPFHPGGFDPPPPPDPRRAARLAVARRSASKPSPSQPAISSPGEASPTTDTAPIAAGAAPQPRAGQSNPEAKSAVAAS